MTLTRFVFEDVVSVGEGILANCFERLTHLDKEFWRVLVIFRLAKKLVCSLWTFGVLELLKILGGYYQQLLLFCAKLNKLLKNYVYLAVRVVILIDLKYAHAVLCPLLFGETLVLKQPDIRFLNYFLAPALHQQENVLLCLREHIFKFALSLVQLDDLELVIDLNAATRFFLLLTRLLLKKKR